MLLINISSCAESERTNQELDYVIEDGNSNYKNRLDGFVYGERENESQLIIKADSSGNGYVRIINIGYNDQYYGHFSRSPEYAQFGFFVEKSLGAGVCKSYDYGKYNLTINGNGGIDSLEINIHYINSKFDTSCFIFDSMNKIPMRRFANPEESQIIVTFLNPEFDLSPLDLNYYYTGIMIDTIRYFDTAYFCHFSDSESDSILIEGLYSSHPVMRRKTEYYRTDVDINKY